MLEPKQVDFEELSERLRELERRHGLSTIDFYRRYRGGELGDGEEMILWAGLYHLYLTSLPVRQFMIGPCPAARPLASTSPESSVASVVVLPSRPSESPFYA